MISKGCFIHQLVTKVELTWSNSICIAPCPYPTTVRYKSKYFNLAQNNIVEYMVSQSLLDTDQLDTHLLCFTILLL